MLTSRCSPCTSLSFSRNKPIFQRTIFSTSRREDHYTTLGVPRNATKAQIKSNFYQLSKQHHPDVSTGPESKEIFHAVSDAYAILGNDRQRRAYDRCLVQQTVPHPHHPYHPRAPSRKPPGATYAWGHTPRTRAHPGPQPHNHPGHSRTGDGRHYEPPHPSSLYHNVNTDSHLRGSPLRRAREEELALESVRRVSGLTRALQVVILLGISAAMLGTAGK